MARRRADILVAGLAGGTLSATDPGIDSNLRADFDLCIRPSFFNHAGNFMSESEGQTSARADVECLAVA